MIDRHDSAANQKFKHDLLTTGAKFLVVRTVLVKQEPMWYHVVIDRSLKNVSLNW